MTGADGAAYQDRGERRRVERAGARLFRELDQEAVAWATVSELSRLVAADLLLLAAPVRSCAHGLECERPECAGLLEPRACIGNDDPAFGGASLRADAPWLGDVLRRGRPVVADPAPAAPEGLVSIAAAPVGAPPVAVLVAGRRRARPWDERDLGRIEGLALFAEAALVAAGQRRRAAEVAIVRERRRIARDLHDTVGQLLFGAGVAARLARESAGTGRPDAVERLLATEREIGRATSALRHALRTLDDPEGAQGALPASVGDAVEGFRHRTGIPTQLIVLGTRRDLCLDGEALLVGVAAEGLRNVERHSRAGEVVVTLSFEETCVAIVVQDDGVGVSPSAGEGTGLGLERLREECRALGGDLVLGPNDDGGAMLRAWVAPPS